MEGRFKNQRDAMKWLSAHLGMYWEENSVDGRYGACIPPKNPKNDPIYAYADTVLETVEKLVEAVEG